jgi:hypothetical protein
VLVGEEKRVVSSLDQDVQLKLQRPYLFYSLKQSLFGGKTGQIKVCKGGRDERSGVKREV